MLANEARLRHMEKVMKLLDRKQRALNEKQQAHGRFLQMQIAALLDHTGVDLGLETDEDSSEIET